MMTDSIDLNDDKCSRQGTAAATHHVQCLLEVPFFGPLPAFLYPDLIKSRSLAIGDLIEWYVYILRRPAAPRADRAGEAFYVGKGRNRRYVFHYSESAFAAGYSQSANRYKINTIRKIERDQVLIQMIPCESEQYAKDLECKLIAHWGRRANSTGVLTNLTDGGDGVSGMVMPPHVSELLRKLALQPVKFAGIEYPGIKVAFEEHDADQIAAALRVDVRTAYCHKYANFKAWYAYWSQQGLFPAGFNYLKDKQPVYPELSWPEIEDRTKENQIEGYSKAWETRYPYPRFIVKGKNYYTLSEAAENEDVGTPSNIAALFRRMIARNHFSPGFNLLDDDGKKLYVEQDVSLQQIARDEAGRAMTTLNAKPVIVNDVFYSTIEEGFEHAKAFAGMTYSSFASQIARYEHAGVFPVGLNVANEDGNPIYPEINPALLDGGDLGSYVKVQDRLFCSMQQASLYFGKSHGAVSSWFKEWAKAKDKDGVPVPFPKGFNEYRTVDQTPLHEEMTVVDSRVPASGYLYDNCFFKHLSEIDTHRKSKRGATSALFSKRRKRYFKHQQPFDTFLNVLALDGTPLYPVDLTTKISVPIARVDGSGHRLHNSAAAVLIKIGDEWAQFDSLAQAWRSIDWLQKRYASADSFTSTIISQRKLGTLPDWFRYAAD